VPGVAGDAGARFRTAQHHVIGAKPHAAFANRQGHAVDRPKPRMVAGGAGNFAIARQDRVVKQIAPQQHAVACFRWFRGKGVRAGHRNRIVIGQRERVAWRDNMTAVAQARMIETRGIRAAPLQLGIAFQIAAEKRQM